MDKYSVNFFSSDRLVVKRAHPILSIIYFFLFLFTLSISSCATRRDVITHSVVTDTTHIVVTDTNTVVNVRDSIRFHIRDSVRFSESETIHERIFTRFDPQTGNPISQITERDIKRQRDSLATHLRDSLATHLRDSILHALQLEALSAHADSLHNEQHRATGSATLTTAQYTMRLIFVWILLFGIVAFLIYALRTK